MNIEKPYSEKTFSDILVEGAQEQKSDLALAVLDSFKKGEPAAIKMVTQALLDSRYAENNEFPLTDEQYKQVIQLAARRLSGEFNPIRANTALTA